MSGSAYEVLAGPYRFEYGPKGSSLAYQLAVTATRQEDDLVNTMLFYFNNPLHAELHDPRAALAKIERSAERRLERAGKKSRVCSTCHRQRAVNGSCWCW